MNPEDSPSGIDELLETQDLAVALESDLFKQFLDKLPVAIAIAKLKPVERVVYVNLEFQRLSGQGDGAGPGDTWERFPGRGTPPSEPRSLAEAIAKEADYLGAFDIPGGDGADVVVNAWSNIIEDESGESAFRLVALVEAVSRDASVLDELEEQVREKDTQLKELQHRVRNNLQMITALIRMEARGLSDMSTGEGFDRLAGRVEALGLLYRALEKSGPDGAVDLGIYLSEIASAVMRAHAVTGTHLDLQVDAWAVSLNTAMPVGLVINELMTNALKHAFQGREAGTITLHSASDGQGCEILFADDGVGLPAGRTWPNPGKLSALIVRSLVQNTRATLDVQSKPGEGMRVRIALQDSTSAAG